MRIPKAIAALLLLLPAMLVAQSFDDLAARAAARLETDPAGAAELYRQALAQRPDWAEGWFYLGASLFQARQFDEARPAFQKSAALAPQNGTVWAFLGLCEYQLNQYDQALADMRKGEALGLGDNKPFISTVRNQAALGYLRTGEFGLAMEQLQPLARIGDDSPRTIGNLGVSALGLAHSRAEVPANKRALVELAGRAVWAMAAQNEAQARHAFGQLLAKFPNEPGVHYVNALYLLSTDPEKAMAECRRELALNTAHVPARVLLANLEIKAGQPQQALVVAAEALKLQPANAFAHAEHGRALLALNRTHDALAELQQAANLAPENAQMHFYLAQAYRRAGQLEQARKEDAAFARLKSAADPLVFQQTAP